MDRVYRSAATIPTASSSTTTTNKHPGLGVGSHSGKFRPIPPVAVTMAPITHGTTANQIPKKKAKPKPKLLVKKKYKNKNYTNTNHKRMVLSPSPGDCRSSSGPSGDEQDDDDEYGGEETGPNPELETSCGDKENKDLSAKMDSSSCKEDDDDPHEQEEVGDYVKGGYHPVRIGETFNNGRYRVLRKLGWGHFSTVWLSIDSKTSEYVALKIMKSDANYTETAVDEIKLLNAVRESDRGDQNRNRTVQLLDSFRTAGPHGAHM